jgi:hypothetical protein
VTERDRAAKAILAGDLDTTGALRSGVLGPRNDAMRDGLPVIEDDVYDRLMETAEKGGSFSFRGYVSAFGLHMYVDRCAVGGLLGDAEQAGVFVTTYAENRCGRLPENVRDIQRYSLQVEIPAELQRKLRIVCEFARCREVNLIEPVEAAVEKTYAEEEIGYIYIALFGPDAPEASAKMHYVHDQVVQYIRSGRNLTELEQTVRSLTDQVEEMTPDDFSEFIKAHSTL